MGAIFILATALRASLLGKELNLLSNLKGNIGVWLVLKRKLSSRSWFLRTHTKHLHHLKSWILSGWQRKRPCRAVWESHAELTACSHWQGLLLPLFAPMKYVFFPSPSNGAHPCQQGKFASFLVFSYLRDQSLQQKCKPLNCLKPIMISHTHRKSVSHRDPQFQWLWAPPALVFVVNQCFQLQQLLGDLKVSRFVGYSKTQLTWTIFYCGCWLRWGLLWNSRSG